MGILYNTSPSTVTKRKHKFRFQIILDEHLTSSGGSLIQENVVGAITPVTITADSGYTLMPPVVTPWGMSAVLSDLTSCTIRGVPRADTVIRCSTTGSLLPYSDQSKIVTYATSDNFVSGSSTWGDGIAPLGREWYNWDAGGPVTSNLTKNAISNVGALGNAFTIYEVLYHFNLYDINNYGIPNVEISTTSPGYPPDKYFIPRYSGDRQYYYQSELPPNAVINTYCDLPSITKVHITVAAFEYLSESQLTNLYLRCNDTVNNRRRTRSLGTINDVYFAGTLPSGTQRHYYYFIGVVAEKESSTIIQNNYDYLKQYYSIKI